MKIFPNLFFVISLFLSSEMLQAQGKKTAPPPNTGISNSDTARFRLSSFLELDSVSNSDYCFKNYDIDSISIEKFGFNALYSCCFKAVMHKKNYFYLKSHDLSEYNSIMAITTSHSLIVNRLEYSFKGKNDIGCCNNIPESTMVSIGSKVYSLYSKRKHLGKIIILESIEKMKIDGDDTGSPMPVMPRKD